MLTRTLIRPDLLEVQECLMGFTTTTVRYWYYDLTNWLVSSLGKQNEIPTQPMTAKSIEWVKTHHLSKVKP